MIRKLIAKFRHRKIRDREIRKLVRKLPSRRSAAADLEAIARMVKGHSFMKRSNRLHSRYRAGKMSYAAWVKYERMLGNREVIVNDNIGTAFRADRKIITRGIARLRKLVG